MFQLTRRDFVKYLAASTVIAGYSQSDLGRVFEALAQSDKPPVVWLQGSGCNGCSVSLLNSVNPAPDDLLLNSIDLQYHPTLMGAAGNMAVSAVMQALNTGITVLVVEGAIPTAHDRYCTVWETADGHHVSMREAVVQLAGAADYVLAVGSCSAFGGIPARSVDTGAQSVASVLPGRAVVNIPGCPSHPDWIIGAIVDILVRGGLPPLDRYNRPLAYFGQRVHDICPLRERSEAHTFGQEFQCLEELGCMGKQTWADCTIRGWNNGVSWCMAANALCIGCTEPFFPRFPLHSDEDGGNGGGDDDDDHDHDDHDDDDDHDD